MTSIFSLCAEVAAARRQALRKRAFSAAASLSASSRPPPRPPPLPLPLPLFLPTDAAALSLTHGSRSPALVDSFTGRVATFSRLAETARATAKALRSRVDFDNESKNVDAETGARASGPRVAVLGRPSPAFAAALWGVWAAGGCAVPLHHALPDRAMAVSLADVGASAILFATGENENETENGGGDKNASSSSSSSPCFAARAAALANLAAATRDANGRMLPRAPVCVPWAALRGGEEFRRGGGEEREQGKAEPLSSSSSPSSSLSSSSFFPAAAAPSLGALVIFTSGTTGRPKPALHSHFSLKAQADSLREAWAISERDVVLNCLPWHHLHGLVNSLLAPLAAGAAVEVAEGFSPAAAWGSLCRGRRGRGDEFSSFSSSSPPSSRSHPPFVPFSRPVSIFMGVPTMYSHLLTALDDERRESCGVGGNGNGAARNEAAKPTTVLLPSLEEAAAAAAALRLSVCGSSACPVPLARRWDELVERGKRRRRKTPKEGGEGEEEEEEEKKEEEASSSSLSPSSLSSSSPPLSASASSSSLLERYGMTEAGMILGQSLQGPRQRGVVGRPMPGVEVKLRREKEDGGGGDGGGSEGEEEEEQVDSLERDEKIYAPLPAATGELLVRWPGMFSAYWGRAKETEEAFKGEEKGGGGGGGKGGRWFATGDVACRSPSPSTAPSASSSSSSSSPSSSSSKSYRLLGRASVDILKVGGEKVSALEVEDALLAHEGVAEAAVVAVDGGASGDAVAAVLVAATAAAAGSSSHQPPLSLLPLRPLPTLEELREFTATMLPRAALPTKIAFVESLPRNAMGKVDKKRARKEAFGGR